MALVFLVGLNIYVHTLRSGSSIPGPSPSLEDIPLAVDGYIGEDLYISPDEMEVLGADHTLFRFYRHRDLDRAWLFMGYFGATREKSQIHSPKNCYPGSGWQIYEEDSASLNISGRSIDVKKLNISDGDNQRVVIYWFATPSGIITDEYSLKWDQIKNALARKPLSAVFIRFSAERSLDETLAETEIKMKKFAETLSPHIETALSRSLRPGGNGK
jgi:EpsI family protein